MVYCGKPSRGCQNCKTRRIKCDEVQPACTQCKKSNRTCPGYPDEFDLIFRNETMAVKRKAQRALSQSKSSNKAKVKKSPASKATSPLSTTTSSSVSPKVTVQQPKIKVQVQTFDPSTLTFDTSSAISSISADSNFTPIDQRHFFDRFIFDKNTLPSLDPASSCDSSDSYGSPPDISDDTLETYSHVITTSKDSTALIKAPNPDNPLPVDFSYLDLQSIVQPARLENAARMAYDPYCFSPNASTVPWSLSNSIPSESTAIPYFFRKHVLWQRHSDSRRGFLELLTDMYDEAGPSSLLHKATYALSLGCMSNAYKSQALRQEARKAYGRALQELGMAIQDPLRATSDEVLMTILLFSLYEQITVNLKAKTQWTGHINGAVTLVKLRSSDQFSNPRSAALFRAVRTVMLTAAIQKRATLEDFPHAKGWKCDEHIGMNAANRLTLISLDLPNLKWWATEVLERRPSPEKIMDMLSIIEQAQDIDRRLEAWVHSLPNIWKADIAKIVTEPPKNVMTAPFWPGPIFTYQDLNIANVMNEYRVGRIFCQTLVMNCVEAIPNTSQTDSLQRALTEAVYIMQLMADDFCSTVPYMLGFDYYSRPGASIEDEKSTIATGGYFASWPLWVIKKVPILPEEQRKWLLARLIYIGVGHGMNETQVKSYADKNWREKVGTELCC
ncbi:hypothetical protein BT63DRAFT_438337 [Microthyrium microscopicum]|uniref:Zn(2)-C6 fungal-type domain-containing protein n=1 Tax=Microthyrium microscopicum TaxID=703497 RepID=A0A6A6UGZ6_9PEZI|nr:hypothetical protein BT63DRAFT_438337 [Microthyrium microscopicum]